MADTPPRTKADALADLDAMETVLDLCYRRFGTKLYTHARAKVTQLSREDLKVVAEFLAEPA